MEHYTLLYALLDDVRVASTKTAEVEECGLRRSGSGNGDGRDGEKPQVGGGRLAAGEEATGITYILSFLSRLSLFPS